MDLIEDVKRGQDISAAIIEEQQIREKAIIGELTIKARRMGCDVFTEQVTYWMWHLQHNGGRIESHSGVSVASRLCDIIAFQVYDTMNPEQVRRAARRSEFNAA